METEKYNLLISLASVLLMFMIPNNLPSCSLQSMDTRKYHLLISLASVFLQSIIPPHLSSSRLFHFIKTKVSVHRNENTNPWKRK